MTRLPRSTSPRRRTTLSAALAIAIGTLGGAGTAPANATAVPQATGASADGARLTAWLDAQKTAFAQQLGRHLRSPHAAPDRPATTVPVANCDDSGPGSLRDAFDQAVSGDVIDLTALDCSVITLTSGALTTAVDDLTINGPGAGQLAIDGNASDRIVVHTGQGDLYIDGVALRNGTYVYDSPLVYSGQANGACVLSSGNVTISNSTLDQCSATGVSVIGGAVHADGALRLVGSTVTGTTATATTDQISSTVYGGVLSAPVVYLYGSAVRDATVVSNTTSVFGGTLGAGVFGEYGVAMVDSAVTGVHGTVSAAFITYAKGGGIGTAVTAVIMRSTIADNSISGTPGYGNYGGWTYTSAIGGGGVYITAGPPGSTVPPSVVESTISGNTAGCEGATPCPYTIGGGGGLVSWSHYAVGITNSTISGNSTNLIGGGVYLRMRGAVAFANATITDNTAMDGAGIADNATLALYDLVTNSSIVAGNHTSGDPGGTEIATAHTVTGANNLIASASVTLPPDTLGGDPMLAPLADNGGPTLTHALLAGSPAIDAGNNAAALDTDQRGGAYVRVSGTAADIGAFEVQANDDTIFADGFDAL